jgi:hypothetical protein
MPSKNERTKFANNQDAIGSYFNNAFKEDTSMNKGISYNALILIEAHLEQNLKELENDLFAARKYGETEQIQGLEYDQKELEDALGEVRAYAAYVANHA